MLNKVVILQFIVSSNYSVKMFCMSAKCASIAGLISSSSRSYRIVKRVTWSRLEVVSVSSMEVASGVELVVSLVIDLPLVQEHILVMGVVWQIGGTIGVSKIFPSGVLGMSGGELGVGGVVRHSG